MHLLIWSFYEGLGDYEIENSEVIEDPVPVVEVKVHEDKKTAKKAGGEDEDNEEADDEGEDGNDDSSDESEEEADN